MRILIVEDDLRLAAQVEAALTRSGFAVDTAHDGREGKHLGAVEPYDAIILDLGLPGVDGLTVLEYWRAQGVTTAVLVLTARGTWRERVTGLRAGADDYLPKPFEMEELLARVDALLRRMGGRAVSALELGDIRLDTDARQAYKAGQPVELTAMEYRLMAHLMSYAERVHSKTDLTEHIYDQNFDKDSNVIEVLVNRLRKKLGRDCIVTRRGLGYQAGKGG